MVVTLVQGSYMKRAVILLVLAVLLAALTVAVHEPVPVEHRVLRIQAQETLSEIEGLEYLPFELQAALLDLSDDPLLSIKAQVAVIRYPELARRVLPLYAQEPAFRDILRRYGETVLPPIDYFLQNSVTTIEFMNSVAGRYARTRDHMARLWNGDTADDSAAQPPDGTDTDERFGPLTAEQRGWYAVNFIDAEGHGFLGQFEVAADGSVVWIQTERWVEGVTDFFTSGIRQLETRQRTGQDIRLSDVGWASLDVLVFASAVKMLRAGRAVATTTRSAGLSTRSAALAARMTGAGRLALRGARYARWPALIGGAYFVVRHPAIISDVLAEIGDLVGVPAWIAQWLGWTLILLPLLLLARLLLSPLAALLRAMAQVLLLLGGRPGDSAAKPRL